MSQVDCPECRSPIRTAGLESGWSVRCPTCSTMWVFLARAAPAAPALLKAADYRGPGPGPVEGRTGRAVREWLRGIEGAVTPALIGLNITVYAAMWAAGVDPFRPSGEDLFNWQAVSGLDVARGQYHRLLTGAFVHVGLLHLCMNVLSLWWIGRIVEEEIGPLRMLLVYLLSGIGASVNVILWPPYAAAGASGAIFGLDGALLAYLWINRRQLMSSVAAALRRQLIANLAVNFALGIGLTASGAMAVSIAGHIGGLVVGAAVGLGLCRLRSRRKVLTGPEWATTAAAVAALTAGALWAASRLAPVAELRRLHGFYEEFADAEALVRSLPGQATGRAGGDAAERADFRDRVRRRLDEHTRRLRETASMPQMKAVLTAWEQCAAAAAVFVEAVMAESAGPAQVQARRLLNDAHARLVRAWDDAVGAQDRR
jgi:membrane associated rhomboid family serine protease